MSAPDLARRHPPSAEVLDRALARLEPRHGRVLGWEVAAELRRPRTTVYRIDVESTAASTSLYYKQLFLDPADAKPEAERLEQAVVRLTRARDYVPHLSAALAGRSFSVPAPLEVDLEQLVLIEPALRGRQIGKALPQVVTGPAPRSLGRYELLGRALRAIADHGRGEPVDLVDASALFAGLLADASPYLSTAQQRDIEARLGSLFDEAGERGRLGFVHGDVSSTNVLLDGPRMGLIDFGSLQRLHASDLFHFEARLRFERPRLEFWERQIVSQLRAGFGPPTGPADAAARALAEADRLLRLSARPHAPKPHQWALASIDRWRLAP